MTLPICLIFAFAPLAAFAQLPPGGIAVSTWVREDIFAGFMGGDMERFSTGMKKLDEILASNPRAADAIAWRAGGELLLAVRAHEENRASQFEALYAKALASFEQARKSGEGTGAIGAVHAISGGSWAVFADRVPSQHRRDAWVNVQAHYSKLRELQSKVFDKLPLHMKGEVLAGLAQASQRLGDEKEFQRRLQEVIDSLPGSPYAARAKRWQENPASALHTSITCQTCHDPGKLDAVMVNRKQQ